MAKNAHKAWSTWTGLALVVAMGAESAMPALIDVLSEPAYGWLKFGLAVATPVLRFVDQGLENA